MKQPVPSSPTESSHALLDTSKGSAADVQCDAPNTEAPIGNTSLPSGQAAAAQATAAQRANDDLWAHLKAQFAAHQVPWSDDLPTAHSFLAVKQDASTDAIRALNDLLIDPLTVTDESLALLFNLLPAGPNDSFDKTRLSTQQFYIRRFHLTSEQLLSIVLDWDARHLYFEEADVWRLAAERAPDSPLFISYVGTTGKGCSPAKRFDEDAKRPSGLLAAFRDTVLMLFPAVWNHCKIWEFADAAMPYNKTIQPTVDARERLLIHLFDLKAMLNRQGGGYLPVHRFTPEETATVTLQLNVFLRFRTRSTELDSTRKLALQQWHDVRVQWAEDHPEKSLALYHPPSAAYKRLVFKQATPRLYNGHVLLAVLGKEVTWEEYLTSWPVLFLRGESRAAEMVRLCLAALQQTNTASSTAAEIDISLLPFVDLFPWMGRVFDLEGAQQVAAYLETIQPFIVCTLSHLVSSTAASDFKHDKGLPRSHFLAHVGRPRVAHWDSENWDHSTDSPPSSTAYIQVPHIDPGRDKYGKQPPVLRLVYLLTWAVTMALVKVAMDCVDEGAPHLPENRRSMCTEIVEKFNKTADPIINALEKAKAELASEWAATNRLQGPLSTAAKSVLRQGAIKRVAQVGFAEGAPQSSERSTQADELWRLNLPDLHLVHKHSPESKAAWYSWIMSVPKDASFRMSCLAKSGDMDRLKPFINDDEDATDPRIQQKALKRLGAALKAARETAGTTTQWQGAYQRLRSAKRWKSEHYTKPSKDLQDKPINIFANNKFRLVWIDPDEEEHRIEGMAPTGSRPEGGNDLCRIKFTDEGISLVDETGCVLMGPLVAEEQTVTWSISQITRFKDSAIWKRMWCWHTKKPWPAVLLSIPTAPAALSHRPIDSFFLPGANRTPNRRPSRPATILPPSYFSPRGPEPFRSGAHVPTNIDPLKPGDGLWILQEFLNEYSPGAGTLFLYDDHDAFPERRHQNLRLQLGTFLDRPTYQHYPHLDLWESFLGHQDAQGKKAIRKTLQALRGPVTDVRKQRVVSGQVLSARTWSFGPRRSSL